MTGEIYVNADTGEPINMPAQQDNSSYSSYMPANFAQKNDKADLLDKIKPDLIAEVMRHKLLGERFDEQNNKWVSVKSLQEYALTELGAEQISNLILGASNQNASLSNLKDDEIKKRLLSISKTAQIMSLQNWREYGIKRKSQLYFIHEIVFTITLAVLKQPENEGIRRLIAGTINVSRVENSQDTKNEGMFNLWGRRR